MQKHGEAPKIVALLYPGGVAADNPEVLGSAEEVPGLRDYLGEEHEPVSTTCGPDSFLRS